MDLFITNSGGGGVVWVTYGIFWCFYQLFGLSFCWHPFTVEDPLVGMCCNAKFLQICSNEETSSPTTWMLNVSKLSANKTFGRELLV